MESLADRRRRGAKTAKPRQIWTGRPFSTGEEVEAPKPQNQDKSGPDARSVLVKRWWRQNRKTKTNLDRTPVQ